MIDEYLIKRVKAFNFPILSTADISNLEHILGVNFSKEFWEFSKIADFEYFNAFNINNLNQLGNSSVIGDIENFCEHKPLLYNPTIFLSFVEFFEYLVKQEEESTL